MLQHLNILSFKHLLLNINVFKQYYITYTSR